MMGKFAKQILIVVIVVVVTSIAVKATDTKIFSSDDLVDGCPLDMTYVVAEYGGFCIDKYEVSPGEDCFYENPKSQGETRSNIDDAKCLPVSDISRNVWRNVSQNQAQMLCAKVGKRLPTNKEWTMAALGTPDFSDKPGSSDCQTMKNWEEQPGETGSAENCISSSGAFDMVGNVWEWTSETSRDGLVDDILLPEQGFVVSIDGDGFPAKTSNTADENYYSDYFWLKNKETRAIARGGNWDNEERAGVYSYYIVLDPASTGNGVGFRCVK